ncbi:hypothetical protein BL107_14080 [Synechococcus sp. BL107]|nr:hypothetical protein BL107_14080 [Synechococcus sp. BL107]
MVFWFWCCFVMTISCKNEAEGLSLGKKAMVE